MDENRRKQLDSIVSKMEANKEKPESIQLVVNDFKSKYSGKPSASEDPLSSFARTIGLGVIPDVGKQAVGITGAVAGGGEYALGKLLNNPGMQQQGAGIYQPSAQMVSDAQSKFGFKPGGGFDPKQYAVQSSKDAAGASTYLMGAGGVANNSPSALIRILGHAPTGALRGAGLAYAQDKATPQSVATGAAIGAPSEVALAGIAEALKPLLKTGSALVKNPTSKSAGQNWQKATQEASDEGAKISWDSGDNNLVDQIKEEVKNKLGFDTSVRKATTNFLAGRTPTPGTTMGENGLPQIADNTLDPEALGGMRTAIKNQYGSDIFGRAMTKGVGGLDLKVASIARDVISKNLHQIAPETLPPDIAMSIYAKAGIFGKLGLPGLIGSAAAGKYLSSKAIPLLRLLGMGAQ